MKITDLRTWVVGNPPPAFGGRYFVFLKLVTDDGIEGVGEAYAATFHPHLVARMIEEGGALPESAFLLKGTIEDVVEAAKR